MTKEERSYLTLEDIVGDLGNVPLERIRFHPAPGTATVQDVIDIHDRTNHLTELVDGVIIEKAYGFLQSCIAVDIAFLIGIYAEAHDLGIVVGADAAVQLADGLVRIPNVSFVSWTRLPGHSIPQ